MALREYEWNGSTWQFEEGSEPEGAKPVAAEPKARRVPNKSRKPSDKARRAPAKGA